MSLTSCQRLEPRYFFLGIPMTYHVDEYKAQTKRQAWNWTGDLGTTQ